MRRIEKGNSNCSTWQGDMIASLIRDPETIRKMAQDGLYPNSIKNIKPFEFVLPQAQSWIPPSNFTRRLAAENCWSDEKTFLILQEYMKFMTLAAYCDKSVTPSYEIDQVWHLHILHMEDYEKYVSSLGRNIKHGPTSGGPIEDSRYNEQYLYTLSEYKRLFKTNPPITAWPDVDERFDIDYRWINVQQHLVIDKKSFPKLTKFFEFILKHIA